MPKRPSPFEPSICRQSKVHLNDYENDANAWREVQERTLKKLLDGPRRAHSIILSSEGSLGSEGGQPQARGTLMQRLVTNYITVNGRKMSESEKVSVSCMDCPARCFFCESRTGSTYQCVQCLEFYCSGCSFVNYESLEDKRTCLSCS